MVSKDEYQMAVRFLRASLRLNAMDLSRVVQNLLSIACRSTHLSMSSRRAPRILTHGPDLFRSRSLEDAIWSSYRPLVDEAMHDTDQLSKLGRRLIMSAANRSSRNGGWSCFAAEIPISSQRHAPWFPHSFCRRRSPPAALNAARETG